MLKLYFKFLIWGFMALLSLKIRAQSAEIQFKHVTTNEGLSHNKISAIFKSTDGFLWFGTLSGLNRFDGHTIKVFKNQADNAQSLSEDAITGIFEGPESNLWIRVGTGLNVFDRKKEIFLRNTDSLLHKLKIPGGDILNIEKDENQNYWFLHANGRLFCVNQDTKATKEFNRSQVNVKIADIALGKRKDIWIIYENGILEVIDSKTSKVKFQKNAPVKSQESSSVSIYVDQQNAPWIYVSNVPGGVYWWKDMSKEPLHFSTKSVLGRLNNNSVVGVVQDQSGRIWIATDHGGLNIFEPKTSKMTYLLHEDFNSRSLSHNGTSALVCDSDGIIWVGTYKGGVSYYHEDLIQFPVYRHYSNVKESLPFDDINRLVEDKNGNLWIGTNGGGLIFYDKTKQTYKQYLHSPADPNSLGSNVVVSLWIDKQDNLWVGTYHGGLNLFQNGKFKRFLTQPDNAFSISDNSIWEIFEDSKNRLWIGTLHGGAQILDSETMRFLKPGQGNKFEGPLASYICSILEDKNGNLWFGTATGIEVFDGQGKKKVSYNFRQENKDGLSNDYISDLKQDKKGLIWVATRGGLNILDPSTGKFQVLKESDGLADNTIHTVLEDNSGKIWVSTARGISMISAKKDGGWVIRNFDKHDGLQSLSFNENAATKLQSGDLLFGGLSGINGIRPNEISSDNIVLKPAITDLRLFNKSVKVGEKVNGKRVLSQSIQYTDELVLNYDQNVFSFEVTDLYFLHPERVKFKYILDGFTKEWLELDAKSRMATFTNLNAGEYIFRVIVSVDGEEWSEPFTLIKVTIKPPFWLSGWAYTLYVLLGGLLLFTIRFLEKRRNETRYLIQQEREEARRFKELDELKTQFFTNVSHEFRTPVSLIISPIDKLVSDENDPAKKRHLELVQRNAKRLLNLVNQLLDFRKVDTKSLANHFSEGDLAQHILEYAESFQDLADNKEIKFKIDVPQESRLCTSDFNKLERIIFNLLSNAFKFTQSGGKVCISAEINDNLKIVVSDTGIGMTKEVQTRIFDRYYQGDVIKSILNQGSGIGLAITKEYISVLGGSFEVTSEPEKGSTFTVILPVKCKGNSATQKTEVKSKPQSQGGEKVLIVEDNDDFRFYLFDNLKEKYTVEQARNFTEAWEKALSFHPDIIVSDVNMPGNTGIELCQKLKADSRTLHIPVILLTALTADNYQIEGIEAGASDYILKPFNVELLLSKIKSHIKQKSSLEKTYKKQFLVEPSEMKLESPDEKFMKKALEIVEANMGNTLFSVEALADEMNVSRVGLYKRILTLSGYTPSELIRNIRLKRAAQLLEESDFTISEIAFEVGFNNPKVFSKYFKEIFGKIPSEYRKKQHLA